MIHRPEIRREMNAELGALDLDLTKAFAFFDTFLDILTQRANDKLGTILAGADMIALDGLRRNHPALKIIEAPVVFFDRGFGASILRSGIPLQDGTLNELPLIQLPHSRITDKCNLSASLSHEIAHEALVELHIVKEFPVILYKRLVSAGAPILIAKLFSLWTKEIGPDFYGFCYCGVAQTAGIMDILSLPPNHIFKISFTDPHPAPWLRVLLSIEWAKITWPDTQEIWRRWEEEWINSYPLASAPLESRKLLISARKYFPVVNDVLFHTRFPALNGKTIPDLFDLKKLDPQLLESRLSHFAEKGKLNLSFSAGENIAMFALMREKGIVNEEALDRIMTQWFVKLALIRERDINGNVKPQASTAYR